jgi:hypothetical protein
MGRGSKLARKSPSSSVSTNSKRYSSSSAKARLGEWYAAAAASSQALPMAAVTLADLIPQAALGLLPRL